MHALVMCHAPNGDDFSLVVAMFPSSNEEDFSLVVVMCHSPNGEDFALVSKLEYYGFASPFWGYL